MLPHISSPLLIRQISRHLSEKDLESETVLKFLRAIDSSYQDAERNKELYEQAIALNDFEYKKITTQLKTELDRQTELQQLLIEAIQRLRGDLNINLPGEASVIDLIDFLNLQIERSQEMQSQLIAAKKTAENASQAKSEFLSMMSHEIRTPLNAIIGLSYIIHTENSLQSFQENFYALQLSANNLNLLINDILDFSKIEAGKLDIELRPLNLRNLLNDALKAFEMKANEQGNRLVMSLPEKMHEWVISDMVRLNQILFNLIANACKFTHKGIVEIKYAELKSTAKDVFIRISIEDTGIGIPLDKQSLVFESFTQANTNTTRKYGGTGLGLVITKRLLNLLGSDIKLHSEPGVGSRFYFDINLPLAEDIAYDEKINTSNSNQIQKSNNLAGLRVLLVEDHPINIAVAKKILEGWKASVEVAENGLIAVEKFNPALFDIVLMDMQMPVMDGYEATAQLRQKGYTVPIIALTASASLSDMDRVIQCGIDDYVSKPFNPIDLFHKLQEFSTSQLDSLRMKTSFDDPELMGEMLTLLNQSFSTDLKALSTALGSNELSTAKSITHNLKGILPLFCHPKLAESLVDFYSLLAQEDNDDAIKKQFHTLKTKLEKFDSELKAWCTKNV